MSSFRLNRLCCAEYVAIACNKKYAVALPQWWRFEAQTLLVLQLLLKSVAPSASLAQIPVYLPNQDRQEPHHLLVATLVPGGFSCLMRPSRCTC